MFAICLMLTMLWYDSDKITVPDEPGANDHAAKRGSRPKGSGHLYVGCADVCAKGSASGLREGLSRPLNPRQGVCPLDPAQPCADWIRARAFPPWTWTQRSLAPPRPPASGVPPPDTDGQRVHAGSERALLVLARLPVIAWRNTTLPPRSYNEAEARAPLPRQPTARENA